MSINYSIAGLSAAALILATLAPAVARDHDDDDGYHHGRRHHEFYNNGYGYDQNNGNRSYYDSDYGRRDNRRRGGGDNGTALGIGLGVVGLALALAATSGGNKNRQRLERRDENYESNGWYRGEADERWRNPDRSTAYTNELSANADCLQTREYQTQVTVGGRRREVYGTSCLTRGGQWLQGPAQLVPEDR
jgi:hypothetical protein